jgi:hypothetical protein
MNNNQIWLKGMLSYVLIELLSLSIFNITEIILFISGFDFLVVLIAKGIVYLILTLSIIKIISDKSSFLINSTFKLLFVSVLVSVIIKYTSSYYLVEMRVFELELTPYISNLVGIDQIITKSFSLVLIIIVILRLYKVSRTSMDTL